MNFFHHKDLGNHLLQLCSKVVKHPVYMSLFFFIVAPCIWISSKYFIYQQMHFVSVLENIKIYIKNYIKIAPTSFGLRPSSRSSYMSLAKVTLYSTQHTHHHGLDITCCHTTAKSITTYFYRFNKCDFS